MYASPDLTDLRQGDVISEIYLPRLEFLKSAGFVHRLSPTGELSFGGNLLAKSARCKAVILSQCCEFNEAKRDSFSLAEIMSISQFTDELALAFNVAELRPVSETRMRKETREGLMATNTFDAGDNATNRLVNCYVYDIDGTYFSEPHIVDFTRITSINIQDKDYIRSLKIMELDNSHRLELKRKLGYFFSRPD